MSCLNKRLQFMRPRGNGRRPSNFPLDGAGIPIRLTRLFPMKLKPVTIESLQASKTETDVVCLTEMMSLFECFEKHEFDRSPCQQHVSALDHCYSKYRIEKGKKKSKGAQ